jgi:hypothetical protein
MKTELVKIVTEIDNIIRKELWFDFHVFQYDGRRLIVAGGIDLHYFHTLEVIFNNVFFFSGYFDGWHSDTKNSVFVIPDNDSDLNKNYEIIHGYQLFKFVTEDFRNDVIIAAETVTYNLNTVNYLN